MGYFTTKTSRSPIFEPPSLPLCLSVFPSLLPSSAHQSAPSPWPFSLSPKPLLLHSSFWVNIFQSRPIRIFLPLLSPPSLLFRRRRSSPYVSSFLSSVLLSPLHPAALPLYSPPGHKKVLRAEASKHPPTERQPPFGPLLGQ